MATKEEQKTSIYKKRIDTLKNSTLKKVYDINGNSTPNELIFDDSNLTKKPSYEELFLEDNYNKFYYNGTNTGVYLNGILIDELFSIRWVANQQDTPLYNYNNKYFNNIAKGNFQVSGQLIINFKRTGYLYELIKESKKIAGGELGIDGIKEMVESNPFTSRWDQQDANTNKAISDKRKALRDELWGQSSSLGKDYLAEIKKQASSLFDLIIIYGNPGIPNSDYQMHTINSIKVLSIEQSFQADAQPIQEIYTFVAQKMDEPFNKGTKSSALSRTEENVYTEKQIYNAIDNLAITAGEELYNFMTNDNSVIPNIDIKQTEDNIAIAANNKVTETGGFFINAQAQLPFSILENGYVENYKPIKTANRDIKDDAKPVEAARSLVLHSLYSETNQKTYAPNYYVNPHHLANNMYILGAVQPEEDTFISSLGVPIVDLGRTYKHSERRKLTNAMTNMEKLNSYLENNYPIIDDIISDGPNEVDDSTPVNRITKQTGNDYDIVPIILETKDENFDVDAFKEKSTIHKLVSNTFEELKLEDAAGEDISLTSDNASKFAAMSRDKIIQLNISKDEVISNTGIITFIEPIANVITEFDSQEDGIPAALNNIYFSFGEIINGYNYISELTIYDEAGERVIAKPKTKLSLLPIVNAEQYKDTAVNININIYDIFANLSEQQILSYFPTDGAASIRIDLELKIIRLVAPKAKVLIPSEFTPITSPDGASKLVLPASVGVFVRDKFVNVSEISGLSKTSFIPRIAVYLDSVQVKYDMSKILTQLQDSILLTLNAAFSTAKKVSPKGPSAGKTTNIVIKGNAEYEKYILSKIDSGFSIKKAQTTLSGSKLEYTELQKEKAILITVVKDTPNMTVLNEYLKFDFSNVDDIQSNTLKDVYGLDALDITDVAVRKIKNDASKNEATYYIDPTIIGNANNGLVVFGKSKTRDYSSDMIYLSINSNSFLSVKNFRYLSNKDTFGISNGTFINLSNQGEVIDSSIDTMINPELIKVAISNTTISPSDINITTLNAHLQDPKTQKYDSYYISNKDSLKSISHLVSSSELKNIDDPIVDYEKEDHLVKGLVGFKYHIALSEKIFGFTNNNLDAASQTFIDIPLIKYISDVDSYLLKSFDFSNPNSIKYIGSGKSIDENEDELQKGFAEICNEDIVKNGGTIITPGDDIFSIAESHDLSIEDDTDKLVSIDKLRKLYEVTQNRIIYNKLKTISTDGVDMIDRSGEIVIDSATKNIVEFDIGDPAYQNVGAITEEDFEAILNGYGNLTISYIDIEGRAFTDVQVVSMNVYLYYYYHNILNQIDLDSFSLKPIFGISNNVDMKIFIYASPLYVNNGSVSLLNFNFGKLVEYDDLNGGTITFKWQTYNKDITDEMKNKVKEVFDYSKIKQLSTDDTTSDPPAESKILVEPLSITQGANGSNIDAFAAEMTNAEIITAYAKSIEPDIDDQYYSNIILKPADTDLIERVNFKGEVEDVTSKNYESEKYDISKENTIFMNADNSDIAGVTINNLQSFTQNEFSTMCMLLDLFNFDKIDMNYPMYLGSLDLYSGVHDERIGTIKLDGSSSNIKYSKNLKLDPDKRVDDTDSEKMIHNGYYNANSYRSILGVDFDKYITGLGEYKNEPIVAILKRDNIVMGNDYGDDIDDLKDESAVIITKPDQYVAYFLYRKIIPGSPQSDQQHVYKESDDKAVNWVSERNIIRTIIEDTGLFQWIRDNEKLHVGVVDGDDTEYDLFIRTKAGTLKTINTDFTPEDHTLVSIEEWNDFVSSQFSFILTKNNEELFDTFDLTDDNYTKAEVLQKVNDAVSDYKETLKQSNDDQKNVIERELANELFVYDILENITGTKERDIINIITHIDDDIINKDNGEDVAPYLTFMFETMGNISQIGSEISDYLSFRKSTLKIKNFVMKDFFEATGNMLSRVFVRALVSRYTGISNKETLDNGYTFTENDSDAIYTPATYTNFVPKTLNEYKTIFDGNLRLYGSPEKIVDLDTSVKALAYLQDDNESTINSNNYTKILKNIAKAMDSCGYLFRTKTNINKYRDELYTVITAKETTPVSNPIPKDILDGLAKMYKTYDANKNAYKPYFVTMPSDETSLLIYNNCLDARLTSISDVIHQDFPKTNQFGDIFIDFSIRSDELLDDGYYRYINRYSVDGIGSINFRNSSVQLQDMTEEELASYDINKINNYYVYHLYYYYSKLKTTSTKGYFSDRDGALFKSKDSSDIFKVIFNKKYTDSIVYFTFYLLDGDGNEVGYTVAVVDSIFEYNPLEDTTPIKVIVDPTKDTKTEYIAKVINKIDSKLRNDKIGKATRSGDYIQIEGSFPGTIDKSELGSEVKLFGPVDLTKCSETHNNAKDYEVIKKGTIGNNGLQLFYDKDKGIEGSHSDVNMMRFETGKMDVATPETHIKGQVGAAVSSIQTTFDKLYKDTDTSVISDLKLEEISGFDLFNSSEFTDRFTNENIPYIVPGEFKIKLDETTLVDDSAFSGITVFERNIDSNKSLLFTRAILYAIINIGKKFGIEKIKQVQFLDNETGGETFSTFSGDKYEYTLQKMKGFPIDKKIEGLGDHFIRLGFDINI